MALPLRLPVLLTALCAALALAAAQTTCAGELRASVAGDVVVTDGATCYLRDNVTISGSVRLSANANLESSGRVVIRGNILGMHGGYVRLGGNLTVAKIDLLNGTSVSLSGTTVSPGELKVEGGVGELRICDSVVGDVVEFKEHAGAFVSVANWWAVKGWWGCGPNVFRRDVKIEKTEGDVSVIGSDVAPGQLSVRAVVGAVTVKNAAVAKLKLEANEGPVYMQNVQSDEGEIKMNIAGVQLWGNRWHKLKCEGNWPDVRGDDNEIDQAEGQCLTADIENDD